MIKLPDSATIAQAAALKRELLDALKSEESVELDASAVQEVDVAGLQILCAAHRLARARGRRLTFCEGCDPAVLKNAAVAAGFGPRESCTGGCLLVGEAASPGTGDSGSGDDHE